MARYDNCDSTCTADCGHCKGSSFARQLKAALEQSERGETHDLGDFTQYVDEKGNSND